MKQLIINADDFGMSKEVNEGIKKGIEAGVITRVSVMVNMPYYADAISYLKKHSNVSVGLHFNITEGFPILKRTMVSTVIREDGYFYYWTSLVIDLLLNRISYKEIEQELSAQFQKLQDSKIKITHIDSHHHIHLYPQIFKILIQFAFTHNVKALRCRAFNPKRLFFWIQNPPTLKQLLITFLCVIDSFFFKKQKQFYEVNNLYDIAWHEDLNEESFSKYLESIPDGTTEIICHPAVLSKTGNPKFLEPRFKGLSLLLSEKVKETLKGSKIKLIKKTK